MMDLKARSQRLLIDLKLDAPYIMASKPIDETPTARAQKVEPEALYKLENLPRRRQL